MGSNLESTKVTTEQAESHQFSPDGHQARWQQELELERKIGFPTIEREHNLKQQGMLPTFELAEEPKRMPYLEDDSTRYSDGTPKPGKPRAFDDSDSSIYADGTPKPGKF